MRLTTAPKSMAQEGLILDARMFSPRHVSGSNGTWRVLPQQRRVRHIGQAKATGVSLKLVKIPRFLADRRRDRQTYGNSEATVTRRGSCILLAGEIMAWPWRYKSSDRDVRRVAEA